MPEQDFALDAAGNSVHVLLLDEPEGALVGINHSFIGGIPSREALRAGQAFILQDGSTLWVQLVENQLRVFREGQLLLGNNGMRNIHNSDSHNNSYHMPNNSLSGDSSSHRHLDNHSMDNHRMESHPSPTLGSHNNRRRVHDAGYSLFLGASLRSVA